MTGQEPANDTKGKDNGNEKEIKALPVTVASSMIKEEGQ
jgi:hypothetical protein